METGIRKINRSMMVGWTIIVLVLFVTYIGEVIKGVRSAEYVLVFCVFTILPNILCHLLYHRNADSQKLKMWIVLGYFVMYLFSLLTGSTNLIFTYILPLLSLLILYHEPKLILCTGVASLLVNLCFIAMQAARGELNMENSKEAEIQIALIVLCFGGCYIGSKLYKQINEQNTLFLEQLQEKTRQNEQMTLQTIMTIVNTLDAKDRYTKGHSQRVSEYSVQIARGMGMSESDVEQIRYIALLHDIGKIGIPDSILNKSGRLTKEEFSLMKNHTVVGGDILKDISALPEADIGARYHHERYDGKGYPQGLMGDGIPMLARIIGIADSFDAMTSNRVYRKRLSDEAVIEEIKRCSGSQFDPQVADVFLRLFGEGKIRVISEDVYLPSETVFDGAVQSPGQILAAPLWSGTADERMDELTLVYNKEYGERKLEEYLQTGIGCLLLVDIDALRETNRQLGFIMGDLFITIVARLLKNIGTETILYRSEGDEFICFLCNVSYREPIEAIINHLYRQLDMIKAEDRVLEDLTITIGAAVAKVAGGDRKELISKAKKGVYYSKQIGRNRFWMYEEQAEEMQRDLTRRDFDRVLEILHRKDDGWKEHFAGYPEFASLAGHLQKLIQENCHRIQIVMFTIASPEEDAIKIKDKEVVMGYLEEAVRSSLQVRDMTAMISTFQRLVVLMDMPPENVRLVTDQVIVSFYRQNKYPNFRIFFDAAELIKREK